jgi:hypothetical protein
MAKWIVNGTTLDFNPSSDTGWVTDAVVAEHHPSGATFTIVQYGGARSARREIEGITKSATVKAALEAVLGSTVAVTDHNGVESNAFWKELSFQEILDATNPGNTFRWKATLIKRE